MDDLIAFLNARLADDEYAARKAATIAGPDWTWKTGVSHGEASDYITARPGGAILADMLGGTDGDMAAHIARHDPARVLREVEAKRAILAFHEEASRACDEAPAWEHGRVFHGYPELHRAVVALAAVYSDHPDYRQEWSLTASPA